MSWVSPFLLGFVIFGLGLQPANSASPWIVGTSDDGTIVASLTLDHISQRNPSAVAVFTVGFGAKNMCRGEIGTALLTGDSYGRPIWRADPTKTDFMMVRVDANGESLVRPFVVKYENGLEALFSASNELLTQLRSGSFAYSRIIPEGPTVEFPLSGAASAIEEAQTACLARLRH